MGFTEAPRLPPSFRRSVRGQGAGHFLSVRSSSSRCRLSSIRVMRFSRDSCSCPCCVNPSTRQKLFETSSLPLNLAIKETRQLPDGRLEITWKNDLPGLIGHTSLFLPDFLKQSQNIESRSRASYNNWSYVAWSRDDIAQNLGSLTFAYHDFVHDTTTLKQAIDQLHIFGLIFIKSSPLEPNSVKILAERIGPLKTTFYGETWDVKSKPSAKNVAYTSEDLDFHMDLLYMTDPPGVQLLHCLQQSTCGGESRFSDAVRAFEILQDNHPDLVRPLVEFPVTYRYKNDGFWFQKTRNFLEGGTPARAVHKPGRQYCYPLDYDALNWSPPFQGPLEQAGSEGPISLQRYVAAAKVFKEQLAEESAVFETKLEEGTCVIFNNRRVLHARRPFTSDGGRRWLKGAYVDGDYLRNRYRVLGATATE